MSITISTMSLIGIILGIMSIVVIIITIILEYEDLIGDKTLDFLKTITSFVLVSSICMTVIGIDKQSHKLNDEETVISVAPTTASLPLKRGDTVKIYGYTEDNTIFKDNIDKEYTIYSVEDRFSISPINVRCSDVDAEELSNILEKSKKVEIKKVN